MAASVKGTVLILGAGMVSGPIVEYFQKQQDVRLYLADRVLGKSQRILGSQRKGTPLEVDVDDEAALKKLIQDADVVVSLLPAPKHPSVAACCLELKKHLVTTSYVSDGMLKLHEQAREAGLLFLNECGLDPGLDHMSAMSIIHRVHREGGSVTGFRSLCGGLPAPEANTNPWGYKFSWSPKGVVRASSNPSRFLIDGETVALSGDSIFTYCERIDIPRVGEFECYPNRNSLPYIDTYGIPETRTMFRGTLRHLGHCSTWFNLNRLGLLDDEKTYDIEGVSPQAFLAGLIGANSPESIVAALGSRLDIEETNPFLAKMEYIGFFSDKPLTLQKGTAADVLTELLLEHLTYDEGERDMCILHHNLDITRADGSTAVVTSTLADYGIPHGHTSMARTVSLPTAMAVKLLLEEKLKMTGVRIPVYPQLYEPLLAELETVGISFVEREKGRKI